MRVSEVMTTAVVGIEPTATLADAARRMLDSRISGLPVLSADRQLVGVITEGDFLRRIELGTASKRPRWLEIIVGAGRDAADYVHSHGRRVEDVMSPDPVTIGPNASIEDLVGLMTANRIKRVLVVDGGTLVGIVTRSDLMRAVLRMMPEESAAPNDDEAIRKAIEDELERRAWPGSIQVTVHDGIAEFHGTIFDEAVREAVRVAAENVAGVKGTVDHMLWIEPMSGVCISSPDDRTD